MLRGLRFVTALEFGLGRATESRNCNDRPWLVSGVTSLQTAANFGLEELQKEFDELRRES
jgi:hypothetical protein